MDYVVIGGGYVGLTLAVLLARKGFDVVVIDIDKNKVEAINRGMLPINEYYIAKYWESVKDKIKASNDYSVVKEATDIFVAIQTPQRDLTIDFSTINILVRSLGKELREGHVLLIESSLYPTATRELIVKPLEKYTGLKAGEDFYVIYSPERLVPDNKKWTIENIPKLIAGLNKKSLEIGLKIYRDVLGLNVVPVSSIEIAEAAKLLENSFRYINIAFVNELKRFYDALGINFKEVIEAAKTKPFGFMAFYPGPGVGGACLEKDTLMVKHIANKHNFDLKLIDTALDINRTQPIYYARKLVNLADDLGKNKLLFFGVGYKPGATTALNSPILKIISEVKRISDLSIKIFDPNIKKLSDFSNIDDALSWADIIILWGFTIDVKKYKDKVVIDLATI